MSIHVCGLVRRRVRSFAHCETPSRRRQLAFDITTSVLVGSTSCLALATVFQTGLVHGYLVSCLCALLAAASLVWRRTHPEVCVLAAFGATLASDEGTALIAATYAMGLYGGRWRALVVSAAAICYLSTRSLTGELVDSAPWRVYIVLLEVVLPAFCGHFVRRQRVFKEQLRVQLSRAMAATDHAARFAIMEKRTRLAFEIHDTVGHHTTYLVMRAGAAQRRKGLSPEVAKDFEDIQESAITAMHELRGVIDVLRDSDELDEPLGRHLSCHEALEGLAQSMRAVGMDTMYSVDGTSRPLGSHREGLLYRVSRESLTNAAKYAPGAPVHITLSFRQDSVALSVRNGRALHRPFRHESGRLGLLSLRTVVTAEGGRFHAGHQPDGSYEVQAVIPTPQYETKEPTP
ncbi:sensor histidine kinase [Streptomyces sp. NPDC055709]